MYFSKNETDELVKIGREMPEMPADDITRLIIQKRKIIKTKPTTLEILETVCRMNNIDIEHVRSKSRKAIHVRPRHQYFLISTLFGYGPTEISVDGYRFHATVIAGRRKALNFCETEPEYWYQINSIINEFPEHRDMLIERIGRLVLVEKFK